MKPLRYINGDVREPIGFGHKLICHCVNDKKVMGAGVALALLKKWPQVRNEYIKWSKKDNFQLGNIQTVKAENDIVVVNMIAQHNIVFNENGIPPVRYEALSKCLQKVARLAIKYNASVHLPYLLCCGLAGGDWKIVEPLLIKELCENNVEVVIYKYNEMNTCAS
jgi:O-acetyl-ADP-ribose deacetylase (regulator of RNase III)